MTDTWIYATFANSTECSGFGCCSYPEQWATLAIAHVLKGSQISTLLKWIQRKSLLRSGWNLDHLEYGGARERAGIKTCLCSPYFCLGCNCCNQLQAPSFKMMLSNYPSISTSWRTIPKSNFCELLPRLYCGICISNLFWMAQHEHVLCHPAHSWVRPCSELIKAARNLCFFFPVLPEFLTPEQITKYKGVFETFDEYLKHISKTEPRVQVSLWNECVLYLEKINSKRNPPIRQLVLKIEMERFTKPQKQSLQVSWSPPPQKCPVSSVSFPVCSCETTQSISLHALLSWHLPSPWGTWATVQRFVLSSFLDSWCSQKKRNYRGCSASLAGIPPSTPAWETSVLEQQLPVCTVLSVYSQGGKILLTLFYCWTQGTIFLSEDEQPFTSHFYRHF